MRTSTLLFRPFRFRRFAPAATGVSTVKLAQLVLCTGEDAPLRRTQIGAGAIHVEREHRHCRAIRSALAAMASLSGSLERSGNPVWVLPCENTAIEIESVAVFRHRGRPAATGAGILRGSCHMNSELSLNSSDWHRNRYAVDRQNQKPSGDGFMAVALRASRPGIRKCRAARDGSADKRRSEIQPSARVAIAVMEAAAAAECQIRIPS